MPRHIAPRISAWRFFAWLLTGIFLAAPASVQPGFAQGAEPPHAWLFGTWSGGLFPVPSGMTAAACLSQPVVIFTRDVVLRATLTDQLFTQRLVSTARATDKGTEFIFRPADASTLANGLYGVAAPPQAAGFGCENPDVLHVRRIGENEINFPGCRDFPNPLVRCPSK